MTKAEKKKIAMIFEDGLKLTEFEKALVRERHAMPQRSERDLALTFGLAHTTINEHLKKPHVQAALARLNVDLFEGIRALQFSAYKNYQRYIRSEATGPDAMKIQYQASRDVLSGAFSAPGAAPDSRRELPEFTIDAD